MARSKRRSNAAFLNRSIACAVETLERRVLLSTFMVTNTLDSGPGSLRDDVQMSNATPGPNTITFAAGLSGTITLTSGQLEVSNDLTIIGPGAGLLTISGNMQRAAQFDASRVFEIDMSVTASISGLAITKGNGSGTTGDGGGAIYNTGNLTIHDCALTGNDGLLAGGAIYTTTGRVTIEDSTIDGNSGSLGPASAFGSPVGGNGGGIYAASGKVFITDCTLSNNRAGDAGYLGNTPQAAGSGGAVYSAGAALTLVNDTLTGNITGRGANGNSFPEIAATPGGDGGGIYSVGPLRITNCTIADNSTNVGGVVLQHGVAISYAGSGHGGGIFSTGSLLLNNTVVAANMRPGLDRFAQSSPDDLAAMVDPTSAYNLIGDDHGATGISAANHNQIGTAANPIDPKLGPLADNGGPTQTMALGSGSPAIDAGSNALAVGPEGKPLLTDQRGYYRIFNGTVDIGAYEFGSSPLLPGDADADGNVDFADLVLVARNYGKTNATWTDGDFNNDGAVGFDDLVIVARNYGRTLPATTGAARVAHSLAGVQPLDGWHKLTRRARRAVVSSPVA